MNREAGGWHAGGQVAHVKGTARRILRRICQECAMLVEVSLGLLFLYENYQICKCWMAWFEKKEYYAGRLYKS